MELDSIEGDTPVFGEEITVCVFQWVGLLGNAALNGR